MSETTRRKFLASTALGAGIAAAQSSPNDVINIAIVGIHGRGQAHIDNFGKIPGVRIAYLCDIDERLFAGSVAKIESRHGYKPKTATYRRHWRTSRISRTVRVASLRSTQLLKHSQEMTRPTVS
jgi:hypothetical protein